MRRAYVIEVVTVDGPSTDEHPVGQVAEIGVGVEQALTLHILIQIAFLADDIGILSVWFDGRIVVIRTRA